jgi:hypothetical protein
MEQVTDARFFSNKTPKIGTKIFINGESETVELTITKLGTKYYHFDNSDYRYLARYDTVQGKHYRKWAHRYYRPFNSPQDAEYWLEEKMKLMFG